MQTRLLGKTGVEVSAYCLGTMNFGSRDDLTTSYQILDQFAEAGGTFLDTANMYASWITGNGGESETTLGQWMKERGNRQQMFVATKVGQPMRDVERGLPAARIAAECDKSLKRLGVEAIDLYYAHLDDPNTPPRRDAGRLQPLDSSRKSALFRGQQLLCVASAQSQSD